MSTLFALVIGFAGGVVVTVTVPAFYKWAVAKWAKNS